MICWRACVAQRACQRFVKLNAGRKTHDSPDVAVGGGERSERVGVGVLACNLDDLLEEAA